MWFAKLPEARNSRPKKATLESDANRTNPHRRRRVDIRTAVRVCLQQEGYSIAQASNGSEALELIHHHRPDLVLLDLAMPAMDGMTLLAEIRSLMPEPRIRVIVMTAHGSMKTVIEAVRLGASDFLLKPLSPEELRQSVASVLNDGPPHGDLSDSSYGQVLQAVRTALRAGKFAAAEAALMRAGTITDDDPAFLNLAGILHESHGPRRKRAAFLPESLDAGPQLSPSTGKPSAPGRAAA